jgi:hypothetical protein
MTHFMVRYFLLGGGVDRSELNSRLRLVLHSFPEDGDYARELFDRIFEQVHPLFAASIEATTAAGDLTPQRKTVGGRRSRLAGRTQKFSLDGLGEILSRVRVCKG